MERPWELKDLFWVLLLRLPSAPDQGALQAIEMCSLPGLEAGSQVWAALVPSGDSEERHKQCCYEHRGECIFSNYDLLQLYAQEQVFSE